MLGTLQTIPRTWSLLHGAHNQYQRPRKFGTEIVLAFLLWMERYSNDKWSSRGKNRVWILECQIQCCSKKISFFPRWTSSLVSCLWCLDGIQTTSAGKMFNGQSINCLLGKFSPTRMIESGTERAREDISELFINYHCYLVSWNWNGKLGAWVGLKTQEVHVVPLPPTLVNSL